MSLRFSPFLRRRSTVSTSSERRRIGDDRGFFARLSAPMILRPFGWDGAAVQINESLTRIPGTCARSALPEPALC